MRMRTAPGPRWEPPLPRGRARRHGRPMPWAAHRLGACMATRRPDRRRRRLAARRRRGAALLHAFARFVLEGIGTPAPVAPTRHLVVGGLYRYVRNPMYIAVASTIVGQALLLGRPGLLLYAAVFGAVVWAFVHWYEEPTLESAASAPSTRRTAAPCPAGTRACARGRARERPRPHRPRRRRRAARVRRRGLLGRAQQPGLRGATSPRCSPPGARRAGPSSSSATTPTSRPRRCGPTSRATRSGPSSTATRTCS